MITNAVAEFFRLAHRDLLAPSLLFLQPQLRGIHGFRSIEELMRDGIVRHSEPMALLFDVSPRLRAMLTVNSE